MGLYNVRRPPCQTATRFLQQRQPNSLHTYLCSDLFCNSPATFVLMSVFSSAVHGVTRYTSALFACSSTCANSPRNHLGYSLKRSIWLNRTQDAYAAATRQLSTTAARYNASSSSPRPARIAQDEPSNRTGGSPRAWQTTAKPDHFLSPAAFKVSNGASGDSAAAAYVKHPLPGIDDSSSTSSRSLLWEGGELKIHDNVENRSTRM